MTLQDYTPLSSLDGLHLEFIGEWKSSPMHPWHLRILFPEEPVGGPSTVPRSFIIP